MQAKQAEKDVAEDTAADQQTQPKKKSLLGVLVVLFKLDTFLIGWSYL